MLFNSIDFLIFFPAVVAIYLIIPRKMRYVWLVVASYYFYMGWNSKYAILIAASTLITYICSLIMEYFRKRSRIKMVKVSLVCCLLSNLGILFVFKYANFFIHNLNMVLSKCGIGVIDKRLDLLLPVGISFYTFQALSYTFDVYRGEIQAERNLVKYALYVSFFPQLVAGPIERSKKLLPQIQNVDKINVWNYRNIRDGIYLMLWGFFQKLVIADRASLLVNNVINNYGNYGFVEISIAIALFAIQIYCDFQGYTDIARGAARVMGFELMKNFKQPYLAPNIKEFWRRWHISLTSWFTDYLYIPLGGNQKGYFRKYINIIIVFGISGLWHGASWNFVMWGLLHAGYQIVGDIKSRCFTDKTKSDCLSARIRRTIGTFILTDFAWTFFVCNSFRHALAVLKTMLLRFQTSDLCAIGLDRGNWLVLIIGIAILFTIDILHEKGYSSFKIMEGQEIWFKLLIVLLLLWSIIMFGIYGEEYDTSSFIYFQF